MQLHQSLLQLWVSRGLQFSAIWSALKWNRGQHNASNAASLMMQPKHLLQIAGPWLSGEFCDGDRRQFGGDRRITSPGYRRTWRRLRQTRQSIQLRRQYKNNKVYTIVSPHM